MTTTDINQQIQAFNKDVAGWGKRVRNQTIFNARRLKHPSPKSTSHDHESLGDSIGEKRTKVTGKLIVLDSRSHDTGCFGRKVLAEATSCKTELFYVVRKRESGLTNTTKELLSSLPQVPSDVNPWTGSIG